MKRSNASGAVGLLAWALAGCSSMSGGQIEQRADEDLRAAPSTTNATGGRQQLPPILEEIRIDASKRAGVPLAEVTLLTLEPVTWSDGSAGCPEPGMMYTQALVPGYRIRAAGCGEAGANYHAGRTSAEVSARRTGDAPAAGRDDRRNRAADSDIRAHATRLNENAPGIAPRGVNLASG